MTTKPELRLFGLKNCDGCRKALRWLHLQGHDCSFADIRDADNTGYVVRRISACAEWSVFVNRRSTTWRSLPTAQKNNLDRGAALALLAAHPTLIKRPVITIGDDTFAGFDPDVIAARLD